MRKLLILAIFAGFLSSCGSGAAYKLSAVDKEKQRGFHANQAKKIIDENEANKKANQKANEKSKAQLNEHLNALNKNKGKGASANTRTFKFY
jgi:hypothetical protein